MDNNFMDEDDGDEIFDDSDVIELDETEYAFGEGFVMSSEESNQGTDANTSSDQADTPTGDEISFVLSPQKTQLLNEFSVDDCVRQMNSLTGTGDLLTFLNKHWRTYAPICFNVQDNPRRNLVDRDSEKILIRPLEAYLCNDLDTESVLNELTKLDDPPKLCGKVFKNGEPSYFCRDCGSDPTCVLCSYCFRKSKHREHRYKMMTSGGGGYCDCGDPEAWKQFPNCELHMPKSNQSNEEMSSEDYLAKLPADLVQRATHLYTFLLDYIFDVLSIENSEELSANYKPENHEDDYVTMLYNDEVHSYDQVIGTLKKVLSCDEKGAYEYATIVDKEGRSALKRGKKELCAQIKSSVESNMTISYNTPLETKVMHHSLVAHQYFAENLIAWLQKICGTSKGLKHLFCKIGLFAKPENHSVIEKLMLSDNIFWKSSRATLHQFFISAYFMDPVWKKEFAVVYIKNYKIIWKNHVKNQDDTVSLTDLTVQLFTVTSLSKYLISNFNLLQVILETLIEHCKTSKGKLSFSRHRNQRNNPEFRRAQQMLFDLKYCLTTVPDDWNDDQRKNFINGFKSFIEFIKFMHGMDSIKRYTQQHIEYEPEWETSFNLSIKLQKSISSLIEWCASDRAVYLECYKYLLNAIHQVETSDPMFAFKYDKVKFDGHSYEIIDYSIMKEEVSIHAPLTRFYAAIYALMGQYDLNFATITDQLQANCSNLLSSLKYDPPKEKMIALIEPSLRALCLSIQTNIGLWKRNGFSLLSQVYFYSNIKCRQEMFDRDVLALQVGASVMEANDFIINLLHHYGLYEFFTNDSFEIPTVDTVLDEHKLEFLLPLVEEFLELLIYVISERYDVCLSQTESSNKLEREVIHQLCISPMPHSDLVKNIYPDNEKYTNELESVLNRIATVKNTGPSSNSKVVYELKEEYQPYYSPYFYHYARSEKTKSEEYQMSLKKIEKEKFFKPPRLPALTDLFANISHLLDSEIFIKMVMCILRRFNNKSKLTSEGHLIRILHLVGLALYEEQNDLDKNFSNENATYTFKFLEKSVSSNKKSLFSIKSFRTEETFIKLLEGTVCSLTTEPYKLLAAWTLDYSNRLIKLKSKIDEQKQHAYNSGVLFSLSSTADEQQTKWSSSLSNEQKEMETDQRENRKKQIAEQRRAKVMAKLTKQSNNFIETNKEFFDEIKTSTKPNSSQSDQVMLNVLSEDELKMEETVNRVVCMGPNKISTLPVENSNKKYQCILCQEEEELKVGNLPMVLCCLIQSSKVLSKNRVEKVDDFDKFDPLFMKNTHTWGINTTSCGHVMHALCWQKYVEVVRIAENRRQPRFHGFNVKRNEFLCPLCETIGNSVLPIYPELSEFTRVNSTSIDSLTKPVELMPLLRQQQQSMDVSMTSEDLKKEFEKAEENQQPATKVVAAATVNAPISLSYDDWLSCLEKTLENSIKKEQKDDKDVFIIDPCPLSTITKLMADTVAANFRLLFEIDWKVVELSAAASLSNLSGLLTSGSITSSTSANQPSSVKIHAETINIMENYTKASYMFGFNTLPNDEDSRMPISMWTNCAYTIQIIDQLHLFESKSLFGQFSVKQADLLSNIVKQAALYGILKNTESVRSNCVRLWAGILPHSNPNEVKNFAELEMFHLLVSLCLSMPNLYADKPKLETVASGSLNCFNIFKLVLQAHCVQIVLAKMRSNTFFVSFKDNVGNSSSLEMKIDEQINAAGNKKFLDFFHLIANLAIEKNVVKLTSQEKARLVKLNARNWSLTLMNALSSFLRCSALFFSNLTSMTPVGNVSNSPDMLEQDFETLITFLGLSVPDFADLLDVNSVKFKNLCESWISSIPDQFFQKSVKVDFPLIADRFVKLPNDFVDLMSMSLTPQAGSPRTSMLVDTASDSATILCLVCGQMLSSQMRLKELFNKRIGACAAHAHKCGNSACVFLRVAECQVMYVQLSMTSQDDIQVRGSFIAAPYIDQYGETDMGLRRGNPLKLSKSAYDELYKIWLSHSVPEKISRLYQNQNSLANVNWQEF